MLKKNHRLLHGDCIEEMAKLEPEMVRLVFADPPYNQGVDYGQGRKADRLSRQQYLAFSEQWMRAASRLLTPDGSFWVLISQEYSARLSCILEDIGLHWRQIITWYETFGNNCSKKFNRTSRHLLYFTRHPRRFVFNAKAPQVRRSSDRQVKYNDKRANPNGKLLDDVWKIKRLAGTHKERIKGFKTQLPLELPRRVIACASEPGDLVLDPFSGSGTTGVACLELGRRYIGIEKNKTYLQLSADRLAKVNGKSY